TWFVLDRYDRPLSVPPRSAQEGDGQHDDRRKDSYADDPLDRDRFAVLVEEIEIGRQVLGRLVPFRGIRFEAARNQLIEGSRNFGNHGLGRQGRTVDSALQLGDGTDGMFGAVTPREHVVENQSE